MPDQPNPTPAFQVQPLGGMLVNYYWCRLLPPDSSGQQWPAEPVNSHGPFDSQAEAWADGEKVTGGTGTNG